MVEAASLTLVTRRKLGNLGIQEHLRLTNSSAIGGRDKDLLDSGSFAQAGIHDEWAHGGTLDVQLTAIVPHFFRESFHHPAYGKLGGAIWNDIFASHSSRNRRHRY